jgi:ADP-heptose:LPS heptosyltransferase
MTILITRHDKIGDFITALPMAKVLKEQTSHKIVMLVSKINVNLAEKLDFVDEVIEYTTDSLVLLSKLNKIKADVSISGYIDNHLGFCLWLSKIPIRIAPATKVAQIFFNKKVKQRRSQVEKTEFRYNLDLLKEFDNSLTLEFKTPLLKLDIIKEDIIIFHTGFGGSSEGNLSLDDYLRLAKKVSQIKKVVFTFGPDDNLSKDYIEKNLDFKATIRDNFDSIYDFTIFISSSILFVSTSTGPMHLAGLTNTPTFSFFGESLFASSKRWATISDKEYQNNFEVPFDYDEIFYKNIENKLLSLIK